MSPKKADMTTEISEESLHEWASLAKSAYAAWDSAGRSSYGPTDMMVRQFLNTAKLLQERRSAYLSADAARSKQIRQTYPLFQKLVEWLRKHPKCADEELLTAAYQFATTDHSTLGILKLTGTKVDGMSLLQQEMLNRYSN